jgi:hypothetical protein
MLSNLNICELNSFYLDLKKIVTDIATKKYYEQIAKEAIETMDNLTYWKIVEPKKFKDILINFQKRYYSIKRVYDSFVYNKSDLYNIDYYEEAIDHLFLVLINDTYEHEVTMADLYLKNDIDLDYSYSICVIPISNEKILFTAYGSELVNYLNKEINTNGKLCKKYNLSYYGYWNNTDKPDDLSDEDWDKRENDWDKALSKGHGIPNKCGMGIDLFNYKWDLSLRNIMADWDEFAKNFPSLEKRVERKVRYILLDEFINNKYIENEMDPKNLKPGEFSYSQWAKWEREFCELVKSDEEMIKKKTELEKLLYENFIEPTKDNLVKKVKDLFNLEG